MDEAPPGRVHSWPWGRPSNDDKYGEDVPLVVAPDDSGGEPYVDSLRQLNRIVEQILPVPSTPLATTSVLTMRQKFEAPLSVRKSWSCDSKYDSTASKSYVNSTGYCDGVKVPAVVRGGELPCDLHSVKPAVSDSLNDSAYETYFGDGSVDGTDRSVRVTDVSDNEGSRCSPTEKFSDTEIKFLRNSAVKVEIARHDVVCSSQEIYSSSEFFDRKCRSIDSCNEVVSGSDSVVPPGGIDGSLLAKDDSSHGGVSKYDLDMPRDSRKLIVDSDSISSEWINTSGMVSPRERDRRLPGLVRSAGNAASNKVSCSSDWSSTRKLLDIGKYDDMATGVDSSVHSVDDISSGHCDGKDFSTEKCATGDGDPNERWRLEGNETSRVGDDGLKTFTCPHCTYAATKKGQVRKHMSVHGIFLCAHCDFACEQSELLEAHRRLRHPGLCGRRLCKKCRILFPSTELEIHERQCSGEKQRWACPECGKEFKFLSVMKAHAHKWHPSPDSATDGPAGRSRGDAAVVGSVVGHKPINSEGTDGSGPISSVVSGDTVSDPKPFRCTECGKTFKTKWTLANHALLHAGADTPFCCDIDSCNGVTFRSDKELNCHRSTVHGLGPTKYECKHPGCTMQFAKYGHFKRHSRTHSSGSATTPTTTTNVGEPPSSSSTPTDRRFRCDWPECGKAFSHQDNLRVHYRRHTDEKPYRCHRCEAAYRQKSGLKYHLEKVHNEVSVGRAGRKRKLPATNEAKPSVASASDEQIGHSLVNAGQIVKSENASGRVTAANGVESVPNHIGRKVRESGGMSELQRMPNSSAQGFGNTPPAATCQDQSSWMKGNEGLHNRSIWSDNESDSEGENIGEDIGLHDDWMLSDSMPYVSNRTALGSTVKSQVVESEREHMGSTSDTEPLDEDLCEELRKLSDVITSGGLSPGGLDSQQSEAYKPGMDPYSKTETKNLIDAIAAEHLSSIGPRVDISLNRGRGESDEHGSYDIFSSPPLPSGDVSSGDTGYARHHGMIRAPSVKDSLHGENAFDDGGNIIEGSQHLSRSCSQELPAGADYSQVEYFGRENTLSNCYDDSTVSRFGSPVATRRVSAVSTSKLSVTTDVEMELSCQGGSRYDSAGRPWQASQMTSESPFWTSCPPDNASSISGHSTASNSAVGVEFLVGPGQRNSGYPSPIRNWPGPGEDRPHYEESPFRGWRMLHQPSTVLEPSQPVSPGCAEPDNFQWHMGRPGESAFTPSGMISSINSGSGFRIGRQGSLDHNVGASYHASPVDLSTIADRQIESYGYRRSESYPPGVGCPWTETGVRPPSVGIHESPYDHYLSRDLAYKPSLSNDNQMYSSPPGPPSYICRDYGAGVPSTPLGSSYGYANNGYSLPMVHMPQPSWQPLGFAGEGAADCLRPIPDGLPSSYQPQSMLYNVVPRYY